MVCRWDGDLDSSAKALQQWVLDDMPDITQLLQTKIDVQAFASIGVNSNGVPTLGKVVLFASKSVVPGVFKALALNMKSKARFLFGWMQPDAAFVNEFKKQMKVSNKVYEYTVISMGSNFKNTNFCHCQAACWGIHNTNASSSSYHTSLSSLLLHAAACRSPRRRHWLPCCHYQAARMLLLPRKVAYQWPYSPM